MFPCILLLGLLATPSELRAGGTVELDAKVWWNPPAIRVPDDRTYVVLFFTTFRKEKVVPLIPKLNRLDRREDVVVVGLSPQEEGRVKAFIKKHNIRFAVGAGSRAHRNKRFGVKSWPHLVVLRQPADQEQMIVPLSDLNAVQASLPPPAEEEVPLVSGDFDENSPAEVLREHVLRDPEFQVRRRALRLLRMKMPPEEFMRFCDAIIDMDPECENVMAWWGEVAYQKHLADPSVPVKQPLKAPSVDAFHEHRTSPAGDPRWRKFEQYRETIETRTCDELAADFVDHLGEEPNNLLIRREIVSRLTKIGKRGDKESVRRIFMDLLPAEPDFATRVRLVGGLGTVCEPGDFEVADFLEQYLAEEENIRFVRPTIRYTIRYLRTGEE